MSPAEQVLHILMKARYGMLAPKTIQDLAFMLQDERRLIFPHQIQHIVGQIKELSVGQGALQPEMMPMQEKHYGMPQHLVLYTGLLS